MWQLAVCTTQTILIGAMPIKTLNFGHKKILKTVKTAKK